MSADTPLTNPLREIRGVRGPNDSDITDTDERDALLNAIAHGDTIRESHCGYTGNTIDDFVRVIAYTVPGTNTTRYAIHRLQGDGLEYIHDSDEQQPVETAYTEAVRDLSNDCGWTWAATDVPGVPLEADEEVPTMFLTNDEEDEEDEDW